MLKGMSNVLCEGPSSERNEITCCWSILRTFVSVIGPSVETLGLFDENLAVHQTFNIFDLKFTTISAWSSNNILYVIYNFLLLINWWACYFHQNHNTTWRTFCNNYQGITNRDFATDKQFRTLVRWYSIDITFVYPYYRCHGFFLVCVTDMSTIVFGFQGLNANWKLIWPEYEIANNANWYEHNCLFFYFKDWMQTLNKLFKGGATFF